MSNKEEGKKERDWANENTNFVQLNRNYLKNWRELVKKKPLAAEIMFFLVEKVSTNIGGTNAVVCSYAVLQEITGYGRSSVAAALRLLKKEKFIEIIKVGSTHAYAINSRVVWRGAGNGKQYAIFNATVVSSSSEQDVGTVGDQTKLIRVPILDLGNGRRENMSVGNEKLDPPDQNDLDLN